MNKVALIATLAGVIAHGAASLAQEVPVEEPAVEEGAAAEVGGEELAAEEEASDAIALPAATIGALTLQPTLEAGLAAFPEDAAKQFTGGDDTWSELIAYATVAF